MVDYKFRVYIERESCFYYFTLQEILERKMCYQGDFDLKILKYEKQISSGLPDIKNKEIFEGDILRDKKGELYIVLFQNGGLYLTNNAEIQIYPERVELPIKEIERLEVIVVGNTIENNNYEELYDWYEPQNTCEYR